jgi:hypothetical protein
MAQNRSIAYCFCVAVNLVSHTKGVTRFEVSEDRTLSQTLGSQMEEVKGS